MKSPSAGRAYWAVLALFVSMGMAFATWAARLVAIRASLGVSPGTMGLILLSWTIGSIATMPVAGLLVGKLGLRRTLAVFSVTAMAGLGGACVAVVAGSPYGTAAGLVVLGVGTGTWDVAMNLAGAAVERLIERPVMPHFHAAYSVGTILASVVGAVAARAGVPLLLHFGIVIVLALAIVLWGVFGTYVPAGGIGGGGGAVRSAAQAWRHGPTIMIGLFITASALTEGAANDWLASGLVEGFGTTETVGIIGLAAFLCAMTLVRAGGARLITAWGRVPTVRISAIVATVGMLLYCLVPSLPLAILGGTLWGLGSGLGFPVGVSAASDDPLHAAQRTSVVVTIAYTGFFIGPPMIGFLANHFGFRHALLVLLGPLLFALAVSKVVAPRSKSAS